MTAEEINKINNESLHPNNNYITELLNAGYAISDYQRFYTKYGNLPNISDAIKSDLAEVQDLDQKIADSESLGSIYREGVSQSIDGLNNIVEEYRKSTGNIPQEEMDSMRTIQRAITLLNTKLGYGDVLKIATERYNKVNSEVQADLASLDTDPSLSDADKMRKYGELTGRLVTAKNELDRAKTSNATHNNPDSFDFITEIESDFNVISENVGKLNLPVSPSTLRNSLNDSIDLFNKTTKAYRTNFAEISKNKARYEELTAKLCIKKINEKTKTQSASKESTTMTSPTPASPLSGEPTATTEVIEEAAPSIDSPTPTLSETTETIEPAPAPDLDASELRESAPTAGPTTAPATEPTPAPDPDLGEEATPVTPAPDPDAPHRPDPGDRVTEVKKFSKKYLIISTIIGLLFLGTQFYTFFNLNATIGVMAAVAAANIIHTARINNVSIKKVFKEWIEKSRIIGKIKQIKNKSRSEEEARRIDSAIKAVEDMSVLDEEETLGREAETVTPSPVTPTTPDLAATPVTPTSPDLTSPTGPAIALTPAPDLTEVPTPTPTSTPDPALKPAPDLSIPDEVTVSEPTTMPKTADEILASHGDDIYEHPESAMDELISEGIIDKNLSAEEQKNKLADICNAYYESHPKLSGESIGKESVLSI